MAAYVHDCRGTRGPFACGVLTGPILAPRARRRPHPDHRRRPIWPPGTPAAPHQARSRRAVRNPGLVDDPFSRPAPFSYIVLTMTLHGVDGLVRAVRQRIETEGLRPFATRTGIPLGQLRSVVRGRAARYTTLQSIASVMGMQLFVGPAERGAAKAPRLPPEITRALHLPTNASVADAVGLIEKDTMASKLRDGMRVVRDLTQRAAVAAELLPRLAGESSTRMMPFAEHVRFKADTGEVEFAESAALSIAVVETVLPSWARADHLTCVRAAGEIDGADNPRRRSRRRRSGPTGRRGESTVRPPDPGACDGSATIGAWSATTWLTCRGPWRPTIGSWAGWRGAVRTAMLSPDRRRGRLALVASGLLPIGAGRRRTGMSAGHATESGQLSERKRMARSSLRVVIVPPRRNRATVSPLPVA